MRKFPPAFLLIACLSTAAPSSRQFTGVITDSMCATSDHSSMKMGSNDAECTTACVDAHGASYVLYDGKEAWVLSDSTPRKNSRGRESS